MQLKKSSAEGNGVRNGLRDDETTGTMLVGSDISAVLTILSPYRHPRT